MLALQNGRIQTYSSQRSDIAIGFAVVKAHISAAQSSKPYGFTLNGLASLSTTVIVGLRAPRSMSLT